MEEAELSPRRLASVQLEERHVVRGEAVRLQLACQDFHEDLLASRDISLVIEMCGMDQGAESGRIGGLS